MIAKLRRREEYVFFGVLARVSRPLAATWWGLIVARGLLTVAFAVAIGLLVQAVTRGSGQLGAFLAVGVVFVAAQILGPVHAQVGAALGDRLASWLNGRLLAATAQPAGIAHLEASDLADDITLARDFELGMAGPPLSMAMGFIAGGLVYLVIGAGQTILLVAYRWWAPLLLGGAWAATHWLLRRSTVWDRTTGEVKQAQRQAEYAYRLAMDPPAAKELRLFGLSGFLVDRFSDHRRRLVDLRWRATRLQQRPLGWTIALLVAANGLFFWSLAVDASAGRLSLAQAVVFAQAAVGTNALAFGGLNWALPVAASAVAAVLRLDKAMARRGSLPAGSRSAEGLPRAEIRLRNVSFGYGHDAPLVLDGLDLRIPAGCCLAVVGVNGAGKTTLMKLLSRLYDPTSGAVQVDGTDLREFDLASWRSRVTAVFQDFVHFELPLRDNVAPLGAPEEVIREVLAQAGAERLADLDTVLSTGYEEGTDLSGGQWQRVALARALCAVRLGAGVVILDEPTAQLDVRGEAEIFQRLIAATRGCTTVLVSHRLSTVRHADLICLLEAGRVAELGTHDELMAVGGRYRAMFELQAARFDEEEPDDLINA